VVVAGPAATTGPVLLQETVVRMSARMQCDLFWVDRQLPSETTDEVLRFWIRKLAAIEKLGLRTEDDYSRAEMDGRVARELAIAVATSASPGPEAPPSSPWTAPTRDVARLCMAVARADDQVPTAEVDVVVRVMGRLTGALDSEELRGKVSSLSASEAECAESIAELGATWEQPQRKALLRGLVEVAAADGSIDRREIDLVVRIAQGFGISGEYVEALVDVQGC